MADADAIDLYHETHGDGPPLVLLHGALGTIESCFAGLLPVLAAGHRVIAVELQAHGHTPDVPGRPLTYAGMAEDVAALIRRLGLGPTDVVGYSMGGAVGIQLATRHPDLVRRVVAAGGICYRPDGLHPELAAAFEAGPPPDLADTPWHEAYVAVAPDPAGWDTLVEKVNDLDRHFAGWTAEEVAAITAPALLIIGDADIVRPAHTVEMFELMGGGVPGDLVGVPPTHLAVLPGTTHVGMLERVDWLGSMITGFLA